MCWKSMRMFILFAMGLAFLGVTCAAPLSEMKHITLHVQSEVLDGHKIVITLEPLNSDSKDGLPVEFQEPFNVTVSKLGKSAQGGESVKEDAIEPNAGKNGESEKSEVPTATKAEATNATTTEGANETTTTVAPKPSTGTETVIVSEVPSSGEPDVQEFLVKFPDIKCPEGFKQDGQGKCRQLVVFSSESRGKSMGQLNSIPEA